MISMNKVLLMQGPLVSTGRDYFTQFALIRQLLSEAESLIPFDATPNIRRSAHFFRQLGYKIIYTGWSDDQVALEKLSGCFDVLQILDRNEPPEGTPLNARFTLIRDSRLPMYQAIAAGAHAAVENFGPNCACLRLRSDLWINPLLITPYVNLLARTDRAGTLLTTYLMRNDHRRSLPDFVLGGLAERLGGLFSRLHDRTVEQRSHHANIHVEMMIELMAANSGFESIVTSNQAVLESLVWRGCPNLVRLIEAFDPAYHPIADYEFDKVLSWESTATGAS